MLGVGEGVSPRTAAGGPSGVGDRRCSCGPGSTGGDRGSESGDGRSRASGDDGGRPRGSDGSGGSEPLRGDGQAPEGGTIGARASAGGSGGDHDD